MADVKQVPGYRIDGRVSIALDALDEKQRQAVGGVITDRDHFLASTADSRKVRKISEEDPLYALSMPSGLRIIYSKVGDNIVVMDLMRQATLDQFWSRKPDKSKGAGTNGGRKTPDVKKATS